MSDPRIEILPDDVPSHCFPDGAPQSEPCVLPGGKAGRRLTRSWRYRARDGTVYILPEGFAWNGANIPRLLWPLVFDPFSPDIEAAVLLHDFLCSTSDTPAKRLVADKRFREVLDLQRRVCRPRRWSLYRGVRIGAWWRFRKLKKKPIRI